MPDALLEKIWKTRPVEDSVVTRLQDALGLPYPVAATLAARGFSDTDEIDLFLRPRLSSLSDPYVLPGMEAAVQRVWSAVERDEPIVVFGDYDVDGITSTALLVKVLQNAGAKAHHFLPHRVDDGYGLGVEPVERCIRDFQPGLIVTVDCGTNSVDAVKRAESLDVDVVVTDHHEPAAEVAPAAAVLNPKLSAESDLHSLAGVGVVFKLCHGLVKKARDEDRTRLAGLDLRNYLDLVALGTIADMVPLKGENRVMARYGLKLLNRTESCGLQSLIRVAGITDDIDSYHVGFLLAPRMNAVGRLGTAETALKLLLTENPEEADELAAILDATNRDRQQMEKKTLEEALGRIDTFFDPELHYGLVIAGEGWHPGVIGIVASRISKQYNRPSIVIALDEDGLGRGSCRSIEGFSLIEGLDKCSSFLKQYGGHNMAAGLQVESQVVEKFSNKFNEIASHALSHSDLRPVQYIDAWVDPAEISMDLLESMNLLRPYGLDNQRPVWAARNVRMVGNPRIVGKNHLKMSLVSGSAQFDSIAFGRGEQKVPEGPMDVAFYPKIDTFRSKESIQLIIQDFRASGAG